MGCETVQNNNRCWSKMVYVRNWEKRQRSSLLWIDSERCFYLWIFEYSLINFKYIRIEKLILNWRSIREWSTSAQWTIFEKTWTSKIFFVYEKIVFFTILNKRRATFFAKIFFCLKFPLNIFSKVNVFFKIIRYWRT